MRPEEKISPAFEPILADGRRREKHEAIVIYRTTEEGDYATRARLAEQQMRLRRVRDQAALNKAIESRIFSHYREATQGSLAVSPIGGSALPAVCVEVTPRTIEVLARQPDVLAIMPNQSVHLIGPTGIDWKPMESRQAREGFTWGLQQLEIPKVWETTKGEGVQVAVLDTGVHGNHPALAGRVAEFILVDPLGRRIQATPMFDASIHGTHVCGTIAGGKTPEGVSIGLAPESRLLVGGVLIGNQTLVGLMEAIGWAVEMGADILNMSLGFSFYEPRFTTVFDVLLKQYGTLPVIAIGNEYHGNISSPGSAYNALAAGAVERLGRSKTEVAFFSSGASLVFPGEEENALVTKPDVVAPGVQVYSCIPPTWHAGFEYLFTYMDGTSMATPHVAGVAALLMAAHPDTPVEEIMQVIKETSKHPGGAERRPDNRWGHGLVQPLEALKALGASKGTTTSAASPA